MVIIRDFIMAVTRQLGFENRDLVFYNPISIWCAINRDLETMNFEFPNGYTFYTFHLVT